MSLVYSVLSRSVLAISVFGLLCFESLCFGFICPWFVLSWVILFCVKNPEISEISGVELKINTSLVHISLACG